MSGTSPRMTIPTQLVLRALLRPGSERYGLEIGEAAGLPSGTIHPILARLERLGWVESRWEDVDPVEAGRPARRYYRLTTDGIELARDGLARAYRPRTGSVRPLPGTADHEADTSRARAGPAVHPAAACRRHPPALPLGAVRRPVRTRPLAPADLCVGSFSTAWQLRRELTQETDPMNDTTTVRPPLLCRLNLHHHWEYAMNPEDNHRSRVCTRCGKDDPHLGSDLGRSRPTA